MTPVKGIHRLGRHLEYRPTQQYLSTRIMPYIVLTLFFSLLTGCAVMDGDNNHVNQSRLQSESFFDRIGLTDGKSQSWDQAQPKRRKGEQPLAATSMQTPIIEQTDAQESSQEEPSEIAPVMARQLIPDINKAQIKQTAIQEGIDVYLDSFFPAPPMTETPHINRDFSDYGFITPTAGLEALVNAELKTLREPESATVSTSNDLFDRIRKGFRLDLDQRNNRIDLQANWYANNPDYLDRTFRRATPYLFHIVEELEARDMPLELALLPLVESAFDPFAYSHGRASGLWQFIPGTGRMYGLHQNWWYDGRRDVLASTQAAIDYLSYLNERFDGNWLHALAAYNSGSGRVSKAIRYNVRKGRKTDFWTLTLPRETRAYVPKLIAISKIVRDPAAFGIKLKAIPDEPYFDVVNIDSQLDLAQAAKMADIEIKELYKLNPGFNQWATDPLGPHRLLIPIAKADTFRKALKALPVDQRLTWNRYTVKRGDSLIRIAKSFNTTPKLIQQVNNLKSSTIRENQKLLIPTASKGRSFYDLSQQNRLLSKQSRIKGPAGSTKIIHTVRKGDTIWDLALAHKVSMRSLAKWNGMAPTDVLKPGKKLLIWSKAALETERVTSAPLIQERQMIKRIGYRVRKGDSLARIASKFSVSIKDLIAWNKLDRNKYLQPGQRLTIFVDITNS